LRFCHPLANGCGSLLSLAEDPPTLETIVKASYTPDVAKQKQMAVDRLEADVKKLERKITNIENVMFETGSSANG